MLYRCVASRARMRDRAHSRIRSPPSEDDALTAKRPIRVFMLGIRGFPDVQGGIEAHAQQLCPLLAKLGCEMHVIVRTPYQRLKEDNWCGVQFHRIWAPKFKCVEALTHSFLGVLYAAIKRPDILHIHAIGPAIMAPLARLLGLRVIVTHHGPEYERQKWGPCARGVLRLGEMLGMRYANRRIAISQLITDLIQQKHGRNAVRIPNGVNLPVVPDSAGALQRFGLSAGKYVLLVSRLVPEKRHLDLVDAFHQAKLEGWKLVIVGTSDHPDEYMKCVLAKGSHPDVVCTGFQSGAPLTELFAHAGVFVLPSSHEGLPIALLEAMSYGLPVLASDIPAHLELDLADGRYFRLGNTVELAQRLRSAAEQPITAQERSAQRAWVSERYCWRRAAAATLAIYREAAPHIQVHPEAAGEEFPAGMPEAIAANQGKL
jgi:glycosyltransferase involved in cell wall biosynthesis